MRTIVDLTNKKFGLLTPLEAIRNNNRTKWLCRCGCGNKKIIPAQNLVNGHTKSCGCLKPDRFAKNLRDLTGQRFGRLVVIGIVGKDTDGFHAVWLCKCDCGNEWKGLSSNLISGRTKSCGCLNSEAVFKRNFIHGHRTREHETTTHRAWRHMIERCENPKSDNYDLYGGRGISVCEEWKKDFRNFLRDMGEKPKKELTLDRKDSNGNYEPSNCRWATWSVQRKNQRRNY